jgi:16S rRNA (guanine527-N7)-methyltransferase
MKGTRTTHIYLAKEKLFNELVMEWNEKINLVSRKKRDVYDLIEESKLFLPYLKYTEPPRILDLGTGGGFPGIVIAIHFPETDVTLADSIRKKINAVGDITARLGLKNTHAVCSRAEDLARRHEYRNYFDCVTARSVAPLYELAEWSRDLLKHGGKLLALKGGDIGVEVRRTRALKYVGGISIFEHGERKMAVVEV